MHRSNYVLILAGLLLAALIFTPASTFAQNASGSLSATVYDQSGAVVPNAKVVLKNEDTGALRDTVSNGTGFFNIPAIQPGSYTLTITMPGFQCWQQTGIVFNQGASETLADVELRVMGTEYPIAVETHAEVAPLDTGEARQTLDSELVSHLAIQGRDAAELIKIMPGMAMNRGLSQTGWSSLTTQTNSGPIGQYSASGTQPHGAVTMTMDGANLLDPGNQGTQVANINVDQTAEVTLLYSAYGAEYAKGPVTLQAIGKSGTSHFHGAAYFYGSGPGLNSMESYAKSLGATKTMYRGSYYPGVEVGGPVVIPGVFNQNRDKLFFYVAPEGMEQTPAPTYRAYFVPTPQMLAGNFSKAYLDSLGPGFAGTKAAAAQQPTEHGAAAAYPGGFIPASLLDPNSLAYAKTFSPVPGGQPDASGNNYFYGYGFNVNRFEFRLRLDYNISDETKFFVSWNRQDEDDVNPIGVWYYPSNALPYPSIMPAHQVANIYSASLVHVFGPSLTNEAVFSLAKFLNPVRLGNPSAVDISTVGLTGYKPLAADPYMAQIPNIASQYNLVPGYYAPAFGTTFHNGAFGKMSFDPSIADNLSKVAGTHTMKFGFYWDFAENNQTGGLGNFVQGVLNFANTGATSSGNLLADFLTGRVQSFQQVPALSVYDFKYSQYSLYAQDQWKAHRRLTLTYGVRFDHMGQWYPTSGQGLVVWDPAGYNNTPAAGPWTGLLWHGRDSKIPMSGFPSKLFSPEPRVGFAFDLAGRGLTVLRGGIGLYRYQISYNSAANPGLYDEAAGIPSYNILNPGNLGWNFAQYSQPAVEGIGTKHRRHAAGRHENAAYLYLQHHPLAAGPLAFDRRNSVQWQSEPRPAAIGEWVQHSVSREPEQDAGRRLLPARRDYRSSK